MTRRVAVVGAGGQLGRSMQASFEAAGWATLAADRSLVDITAPRSYRNLTEWRPEVVVNCAAWTDVDGCARDPERADLVNGTAPGELAQACASATFVHISTNEVFAGNRERPYVENDAPSPISAYGRSKLLGEERVQDSGSSYMIVRTAWLFGPGGANFVTKILRAAMAKAESGEPLRVVADEWGNPTWTPLLAAAVVDILERPIAPPKILHLAGEPPTTRIAWAEAVVAERVPQVRVVPIAAADYVRASSPPLRAVLSTELARSLGIVDLGWRRALGEYLIGL